MSKLGKLQASIILDGGYRPHYGPGDAVSGRVLLDYSAQSSIFKKNVEALDLFGPLKISVFLHGEVVIRIRRGRDVTVDNGMHLFERRVAVLDGPFQAQVGKSYEYPFTISFPEGLVPIYPRQGRPLHAALPPSVTMNFSDCPDILHVAVIYRVAARISMPGINVKLYVPPKETQPPVRYDLPRPPNELVMSNVTTFSETAEVQNEYLLPENERPQGLKQKAKALLSSNQFPKLVLCVTCSYPQFVYPTQRLNLTITARRDDAKSSTIGLASFTLESVTVELLAHSTCDGSARFLGQGDPQACQTVQNLVPQHGLPFEFSKNNDYSSSLGVGSLLPRLTSSFRNIKLSRSYAFRIALVLKVARRTVQIRREVPVVVLPIPEDIDVEITADSSTSHPSWGADDPLPMYQEMGPSSAPFP